MGSNKLFWFFAWEGMKDGQPNPYYHQCPDRARKAGRLLPDPGSRWRTQLYDPFTATQTGTTINRSRCRQQNPADNTLSPIAQAYSAVLSRRRTSRRTRADGLQQLRHNAPTTDNSTTRWAAWITT